MVGITLPPKLQTAGLFDYTPTPTIDAAMKVLKKVRQVRCFGYVIGALFGLLLPAAVIILIAATTEEMPRVVSVWPLLAVLLTSVLTWWLQGLIYSVLARPHLKNSRVGDMFRVDMAGLFVALVSPIRGAELPYKAFLLNRLGFSAGEGSSVVVTRVLLDAIVLTPAALMALALYSSALTEARNPNLLLTGLGATIVLAAVAFLVRRRLRGSARQRTLRAGGSSWQVEVGAKVSGYLRDMHRSFASYGRPGHRTTLLYAVALTIVYWVLRLSVGPMSLMSVGWSGDWLPVVAAQLLLASFILPFAPTPGGGGVRELGLAALLSGYVPEGQLLSGLVVYTALTYWLPLIASTFFAGHELRRGQIRRKVERKVVEREGYAEATTQALLGVTPTAPPRHHVSFGNPEPAETRTWQHNMASSPVDRIPQRNRV
jgi:glycosyltransferase 2 family protein